MDNDELKKAFQNNELLSLPEGNHQKENMDGSSIRNINSEGKMIELNNPIGIDFNLFISPHLFYCSLDLITFFLAKIKLEENTYIFLDSLKNILLLGDLIKYNKILESKIKDIPNDDEEYQKQCFFLLFAMLKIVLENMENERIAWVQSQLFVEWINSSEKLSLYSKDADINCDISAKSLRNFKMIQILLYYILKNLPTDQTVSKWTKIQDHVYNFRYNEISDDINSITEQFGAIKYSNEVLILNILKFLISQEKTFEKK